MEPSSDGIPHGTSSGFSYHRCRCDVCVAAKKARDRDYYERNREKVKAQTSARYYANRDDISEQRKEYRARNAEAIKRAKKAYYERNAEEIKAKVAAWAEANPERMQAHRAKYREVHRLELRTKDLANYYRRMAEDPEKVRAYRRAWAKTQKGILANRAARHARRGVPYTQEALDWIAGLVDPVCHYCGRLATEIDHMLPVARGGIGERSNLVPCCRRCNARKGDMTADEFIAKGVF